MSDKGGVPLTDPDKEQIQDLRCAFATEDKPYLRCKKTALGEACEPCILAVARSRLLCRYVQETENGGEAALWAAVVCRAINDLIASDVCAHDRESAAMFLAHPDDAVEIAGIDLEWLRDCLVNSGLAPTWHKAWQPPTARQLDVLRAISGHISTHGWPPTLRDLGKELNVSFVTVRQHLVALGDKSLIEREATSRSIRLTHRGRAAILADNT